LYNGYIETTTVCELVDIFVMSITIPKNLDNDLIKVLSVLCLNIQKDYDISPQILNTLINNTLFLSNIRFIYEQCSEEMSHILENFKSGFDTDSVSNQITTEEYEKCGYLITSHQNSYITYCNIHKYLHPDPHNLTEHRYGISADHCFSPKTPQQVIKERYNMSIHKIYQTFINKISTLIRQLFIHMFETLCIKVIVKVTDENVVSLMQLMKDDQLIFKSRTIYEYIGSSNEQNEVETQNHHENKFYYVKVYKFNTNTNTNTNTSTSHQTTY
jgi:hypothetical protein